MLRKMLAALTVLAMLLSAAAEEAQSEQPQTPSEEVRALVESLFAAAAGTEMGAERELRKTMTGEEIAERNAACAEYRAKTLPWLTEALRPEPSAAEEMLPTPEPEASPAPGTEPVYTIEDSRAAFEENELGRTYLEKLAGMGAVGCGEEMQLTREICRSWMEEVDHARLAGMNGDYRCWIYLPDTQIDYPVVQCGDNSRYLKRLFNGDYNSAGTLFIDFRNLPGFQDPNTLLYGHHMRNDSMFGALTDYEDQVYFEGHPYALVTSAEEIFLLEIFAGYTTSDRDHCYDIAISDEEDMRAFISEAADKSDFVSGVEVLTADRLVTLSTCAYAFENARYIAIGRILPVWSREPAQDMPGRAAGR